MATGDVSLAQNGAQSHVKLHPYLVALVRWCVSCVWSTATVVLHRLVAGSLPGLPTASITGFYAIKPPPKTRVASKDHLHPEPKVECQILHTPQKHGLDVIFVHGLYGSLGNTWRQGEWRARYKLEPDKVPLLRPSECKCNNKSNLLDEQTYEFKVKQYSNIDDEAYNVAKTVIPNDKDFYSEKFFNNGFINQVEIVDNYETQANFVRDLFVNENRKNSIEDFEENANYESKINGLDNVSCKFKVELESDLEQSDLDKVNCKCKFEFDEQYKVDELDVKVNCECKIDEGRSCEVGCGCGCDECYSSCWPRDWIKEDFPEARVISINYTSDPYLWRPLWIKQCKRLRLHERAEQMTRQLLNLRVGEKPIIWVGHSKGGLFIKQIYCEAYEAHLKIQRDKNYANNKEEIDLEYIKTKNVIDNDNYEERIPNIDKEMNLVDNKLKVNDIISNVTEINDNLANENELRDNEKHKIVKREDTIVNVCEKKSEVEEHDVTGSSNMEEDHLSSRAGLWLNSAGFMLYSVPHRGSPLADIKTPLTARSIELLEITKDSSLVLSLQERWLLAAGVARPQVRSLVETTTTLMGVLWLRIVSAPSADAGIGSLYGVPLDHREICKPSSRRCLLYTELIMLIRSALRHCKCNS